jgi:hypothetical protein
MSEQRFKIEMWTQGIWYPLPGTYHSEISAKTELARREGIIVQGDKLGSFRIVPA